MTRPIIWAGDDSGSGSGGWGGNGDSGGDIMPRGSGNIGWTCPAYYDAPGWSTNEAGQCVGPDNTIYNSDGTPIGTQPAASGQLTGVAACRRWGMRFEASNGFCSDGQGGWYDPASGRLVSHDPMPAGTGVTTILGGDTVANARAWISEHKVAAVAIGVGLVYLLTKGKK